MAKLIYTDDFALHEALSDHFNTATTVGDQSDSKLHFIGNESWQVTLRGENINLTTTIATGRIDSIVFTDEDGTRHATIKGLGLHASDVSSYLQGDSDDFRHLLEIAMAGKDDVIGSKRGEALYGYGGKDHIVAGRGQDGIYGGTGNDTLTGGTGADVFFFSSSDGHDVITDFDAIGGNGKHDILQMGVGDIDIISKGHDTLIRYGDGGEILLEGVDRSDVSLDHDFFLVP